MSDEIPLLCTGGRYPFRLTHHDAQNIRGMIYREGDLLRIRLDDISHIDRWEEFMVPVASLIRLLGENESRAS